LKSKSFQEFLPKFKIFHSYDKEKPLNFYSLCALLHVDYWYHSKSIPENEIDSLLDRIIDEYQNSQDNAKDIAIVMVLGISTMLYFEKMDKRVVKFAEKWGRFLKTEKGPVENFDIEPFCNLLISNVSFFQEKLFPNVSLSGIEDYPQVVAMLEGKYFRYMTKKKEFFRDLKFKFQ
jgi:hypothetical protein